ncbi:MAG: oxygen-independent coproporphyrinogen III oxidase [Alphaproteobacteria bacterium]|nr:oxygen-independent coproporphyrinogen III oxidase [Alphaproteobacteria bacterium]
MTGVFPDKSLNFWLERPVPRYTSYPPAPAFHPGVAADAYAASLAGLSPDTPVSLYLHIPFCRDLCLYCGCNTTVTHRDDRIDTYMGALQREIVQTISAIPHRPRIASIHWGGGTPNILSDKALREMFAMLADMGDMDSGGEIAMEIDPRHAGASQIETLAGCGVTRVSLGVQDFDADVQKLINRVQPYEMVERTCAMLRDHGITAINFDLIYGLPRQTPDSVAQTARQVAHLRPSRIALFSYAHVPQLKKHQKILEDAGLPDKYARLAMESAARGVLRDAGYVEIGMDHFALSGDALELAATERRLRRNFQGYTTDNATALLGFGASSISSTPDGYFQNERLLPIYQEAAVAGTLPAARGLLLTDEDRLRGRVIETLMCYMACDVAAICAQMNMPMSALDNAFAALHPMQQAGLVAIDGAKLRLLSPYRMAVRVACQAFDAYAGSSIASRAA